MASNINPFNIDGTYPVAGQDNDSQGFRDNFTNIRNNFTSTKAELEDLQSKVVLKSALTGTTLDNNFSGSPIVAAQLRGTSETVVDHGILIGTVGIDFSTANVHKITTSGSISLTFSNWPTAGQYGRLIVWVYISDPSHTLQFPVGTPPAVTKGLADIAGINAGSGIITFDAAGDYVFEFSSSDNGQNILIQDLTRNRATFRDPAIYYNPSVSSGLLLGFNSSSLATALTLEAGQDAVSTYGSHNSISFGNLTQANLTYGQMDTGGIGGYSVTTARGNIFASTITPVKSNDYLGYVNAVTFTGNGAGNVFQQVSSINFFATGSNVTAIGSRITALGNISVSSGNVWANAATVSGSLKFKLA